MPVTQRTTNANTPAIVTISTTALAANPARIGWTIQNLGTATLYVLFGSGASSTVYHVALKAGAGTDDGSGGSFTQSAGTVYTGIITIASSGIRYTVLEMAP